MAFNLFPYSNFHKLNLDWVIKTVKEAKEAMDLAVQTVTGYESRLQDLETATTTLRNSLGLLQGVVSAHTMRLDQAQNDIQNHTQRINSLDSTIQAQGQEISDLPQIRTQVNNALTMADNAVQAADNAVQVAEDADETASTALTQSQALQTSKMPKTNPIGTGTLIMNATTMDDGLVLQDTVLTGVKFKASLGGLSLVSMSAGSEQPSQKVKIRGVAYPTANSDAATKEYVDGLQSTVSGTTVEITPANNTIYKCGVLEQLTISNPSSAGAYSIIFTSGATPTTTIIPATILGLETFVAAANTIYEINVLDNRAVVGSWEVASA
jgi:uncharacterized coiled-coil protein SlyX